MKSIHEAWKVFTKHLCLPRKIFQQVKLKWRKNFEAPKFDLPIKTLHKVFVGFTDFPKVIGESHVLCKVVREFYELCKVFLTSANFVKLFAASTKFIKVVCESHKLCKVVREFYELCKVFSHFCQLYKVVHSFYKLHKTCLQVQGTL